MLMPMHDGSRPPAAANVHEALNPRRWALSQTASTTVLIAACLTSDASQRGLRRIRPAGQMPRLYYHDRTTATRRTSRAVAVTGCAAM